MYVAHTHRYVGFGGTSVTSLLSTLMFQLLLQAKTSVANQNIVDLLKVEIDVVVVMRVLATMALPFALLFGPSAGSVMHLVAVRSSIIVEAVLRLIVLLNCMMTLLELVLVLMDHVYI